MNRYLNCAFLSTAILCARLAGHAAILPAEQLLPADTLGLITVPDFAKAQTAYGQFPLSQLWNDPALKPFKDKFTAKFKEELIVPLEGQLGVKFADYANLAQGQVAFAVVQNGWQGDKDQQPSWVLLLDTKHKSEELKKRLSEIKLKWTDAGKTLKSEKIRDLEFTTLMMDSDEVSRTLKKSLGETKDPNKSETEPRASKLQITIGQVDSLLLVGDTVKVLEKIVIRQTGGLVPNLAEQPTYEANHQALFRDALFYGWVHFKPISEVLQRLAAEAGAKPPPNPLAPQPGKVMAATGLNGLKSLAFKFNESHEGGFFQLFVGVPESNRRGIFKMIIAENKESAPPPFVPGEVVKFNRWRMDGQKLWAALESLIQEISPQMSGLLQMSLAAIGKDKDPNFDFKRNFIGNLGDDIISYQKTPRSSSLPDLNSPPSLVLIGSPNPDQLLLSLKAGVALLPPPAGTSPVADREFLGRKIYSVPLMPAPALEGAKPAERSLHFAAGGGYVGLSTDPALLEEFLRNKDANGQALREKPGLADAAQKVGGMGTGLFGFENSNQSMRIALDALKNNAAGFENIFGLGAGPGKEKEVKNRGDLKEWFDFSLLPSFDKIAKYFYFFVYASQANQEGLTLKMFYPQPPELRK